MNLTLNYLECHMDVAFWSKQKGARLNEVQGDGWGEFTHTIKFRASNLEQA